MAKTILVDKIGRLIDEKPYYINWFNYDLGGGFGCIINKDGDSRRGKGAVVQGIHRDTSVQKVMKLANQEDFDEIAGFYPAIFMFFGKKFIDKVDFSDGKTSNRISRLVDNLKGPAHLKDNIYDFVNQKFDFIAFLEACGRNEKLNFDLKSAISVYKLQGDAAIYPILCQIFYVNKGADYFHVQLIEGLPIDFPIEVSDYMSGCHFPVVVSPACSEFEWRENANGHFLYGRYGDDWGVLDVASVGRFNLSNYALANRLNYLGGGGVAVPYLVCSNWGDIIDAYHHFGGDLLIRDLKNDLFNHYWFVFGLNSRLNVMWRDNLINGLGKYQVATNIDLPSHDILYITVDLGGNFINYCEKDDICFSKNEIHDCFELADLIK